MFKGISFYAAGNKNFPHRKAKKCFNPLNPKPALVTMLSFGSRRSVPKYFCKLYKDRAHVWEIHFGFRDFSDFELTIMNYRTTAEIVKRCNQVKKWINRCANKNTVILLCPICEDTVSLGGWQNYARIIRDKLPQYSESLVRSTLSRRGGGNYQEEHPGFNFSAWYKSEECRISNMDGVSIRLNSEQNYHTEVNTRYVEEWLEIEDVFVKFVWEADPQGLRDMNHGDPKPPFNKRKYILTDRAIEWYYRNIK